MIEYKGYEATIDFDQDEGLFIGTVANIRDVITFHGKDAATLEREMAVSIDDYLEFCRERSIEPAKPYSGRFNVRIQPDVHRAVALAAASSGQSMNDWVADTLTNASSEFLSKSGGKPARAKRRRPRP
jgi:predicted HicB family RNase H-like nuclease